MPRAHPAQLVPRWTSLAGGFNMAHALGLHLFPPHLGGHHAAMDCSLLGLILPPGEFHCMFPAAACPPPLWLPRCTRKHAAGYCAADWHECSTAAAAAAPAAAAAAAPATHARPAACPAGEKTVLKAQFDEDVIETLHITQVWPSPRLLALLRCPPSIGARMDGLPAAWGLNGPPRLWPLQVALGPKPKPGPHVVMVEKGGQKFAIGTLDAARCTQVGARPPTAAWRLTCAGAGTAAPSALVSTVRCLDSTPFPAAAWASQHLQCPPSPSLRPRSASSPVTLRWPWTRWS